MFIIYSAKLQITFDVCKKDDIFYSLFKNNCKLRNDNHMVTPGFQLQAISPHAFEQQLFTQTFFSGQAIQTTAHISL